MNSAGLYIYNITIVLLQTVPFNDMKLMTQVHANQSVIQGLSSQESMCVKFNDMESNTLVALDLYIKFE